MSRPLRIEYPDAWYHVINRARRGQILYVDTDDYRRFLDLLQDTADMFNILKKHSSVSSLIERTQNRLGMDRQFTNPYRYIDINCCPGFPPDDIGKAADNHIRYFLILQKLGQVCQGVFVNCHMRLLNLARDRRIDCIPLTSRLL